MRKLIASVNITLDGFMAGPDCELDWHFKRWTTDMADVQTEQLSCADTILLGRVTYSAMAAYWAEVRNNLIFPRADLAFAQLLNSRQKVVFSRTVEDLRWDNSARICGNLSCEILKLKQMAGSNIIIYGSGKLIAGLIKLRLIDEYIVWLHPVLLGKGKPLFGTTPDVMNMQLVKNQQFTSGVVLLHYSQT